MKTKKAVVFLLLIFCTSYLLIRTRDSYFLSGNSIKYWKVSRLVTSDQISLSERGVIQIRKKPFTLSCEYNNVSTNFNGSQLKYQILSPNYSKISTSFFSVFFEGGTNASKEYFSNDSIVYSQVLHGTLIYTILNKIEPPENIDYVNLKPQRGL